MVRNYRQQHQLQWLLLFCSNLALLLILFPYDAVLAHGGGTSRLDNVAAGPYRLYAWTQPEPLRVGEIHVTIGVVMTNESSTSAEDGLLEKPVTEAEVTVTFVAVDGTVEAIETLATLGGPGSVYYETDAILPTAGAWRFIIDVNSAAGDGSVEFVEELLAVRRLNVPLALGGGGVFVILIVLIGVWNRLQEKKL